MATKPRAERVSAFLQTHYTRGDGKRLAEKLHCSPGLLSGVVKGRYFLGDQYWDGMAEYYGTTVNAILYDSFDQDGTLTDTPQKRDLLGQGGRDRKGTLKVGAHAAPAYEARRLQSVVTIYESAFAHLRKRALEEVGYIDKILSSVQVDPAPSAKPGRRRHDRRHAHRPARRIVK